jgi:hypothetical protein
MPQDFAPIAGATTALTKIAQQRSYGLAVATGGWRASALFKLEKAGIPVVGLPAAFADDAAEREEIARIAIVRARFRHHQLFDRIILVGDSDCDVTTAARLGFPRPRANYQYDPQPPTQGERASQGRGSRMDILAGQRRAAIILELLQRFEPRAPPR